MKNEMLGVDIGGTTIKFAIIDTKGNIKKRWSIDTDTTASGKHIPQNIISSIQSIVDIQKNNLIGIGIDVPGPISVDGSHVIRAVNLGWNNIPLKDTIGHALHKPVVLTNDANAAALGEMWCGVAKGKSNLIFVILGTGVGGGIIIDGKVLNGAHSSGGEIGHIPVESNEKRICGCGNINCLETYASATGIIKNMEVLLKKNNESRGTFEGIDIFKWVSQGDQLAKHALDITVHYLGTSIAGIMNTIDAEGIVIGGGLSGAGNLLIDPLRKEINNHIFPEIKATGYFIEKAALGNDAGVCGAVYPLLKLINQ